MVMRCGCALALGWILVSQATGARAQDWTHAGGDLFVALGPADGPTQSLPTPGDQRPLGLSGEVQTAALRRRLDPRLLAALVAVESGYRPRAVSPAGAIGLTQLMPATASQLGVTDRFDIRQNLDGGARYLADQLDRFGDLRLALAAFNAGPATVARLGRIPRIPETQDYVRRVVDCYLALSIGREVRSARDCPGHGDAP